MRKLLEQISDPSHWDATLRAIRTARYHLLTGHDDVRPGELLRLILRSPDATLETFDARVTRVTPGKGAALEVYPVGLAPWDYDTEVTTERIPENAPPEEARTDTPVEDESPADEAPPVEEAGPAATPEPPSPRRTLHARIQALSAQEKKKLAMTADRTERAILIRDQLKQIHPYVLRNPLIQQEEVGEYAKYAGLSPVAIKFISEQLRWMQSPTLRFTLMRNPQIPREVAASIADGLNLNQLRWLLKHSGVRPDIRQVARRILERRGAM